MNIAAARLEDSLRVMGSPEVIPRDLFALLDWIAMIQRHHESNASV